jgi:DNA (cytosine-5)-methyltransferase 1
MKSNGIRTIDLFCGCGGMVLGFKNAGFETVSAADNWDAALETLAANLPDVETVNIDLSKREHAFSFIRNQKAELIIGGPPCQDFSHAGKRDESMGRADLTVSFAETVAHSNVKWFVMENVDRAKNSNAIRIAKKVFEDAGYGLTEAILDASLCNVPQKRKRYFLIGELGGKDSFLLDRLLQGLSHVPLTVRQFFHDNGLELDTEFYYRHPRTYARRGIFSIDEPSPTIRGVNRPIPSTYRKHKNDPVGPERARPLTAKERSLIQTFPNGFEFCGTKTEIEQMIGNAVPVKMAEYVARCLHDHIAGSSVISLGQLALVFDDN